MQPPPFVHDSSSSFVKPVGVVIGARTVHVLLLMALNLTDPSHLAESREHAWVKLREHRVEV